MLEDDLSENEKNRKRTRRTEPYPGLYPHLHPRTRWEYFDQDYIDKLSPDEKRWLSNFNEEFVGGNFWHKDGSAPIHTTPEGKKDCYSRNNARNRDYYAINRNYLMGEESDFDFIKTMAQLNPEDEIIEEIDESLYFEWLERQRKFNA